jgi:hypothetical protein
MRRLLVVCVLLAAVAGSCSRSGGADDALVLDGRPRFPDAQGVVRDVTFTKLTLADGTSYRITRDLRCFSTYTLGAVPLLGRKGQFVQLGLEGDRVAWLASVGAVVNSEPPAVYYTGRLVRADAKRRAIFRDGTVFALGDGVDVPPAGFVQVAIDPATGMVRAFF